jgi:hypothetical protein
MCGHISLWSSGQGECAHRVIFTESLRKSSSKISSLVILSSKLGLRHYEVMELLLILGVLYDPADHSGQHGTERLVGDLLTPVHDSLCLAVLSCGDVVV